jgi:drug/metabolite transporter (DMT)-like permease
VLLAFALLYTSWGTTYFAIKEGVKYLPPCLFGGTRLALAGLILLSYLAVRGERLLLSRHEFLWTLVGGLFFFVGGNGLITIGEITVDSGVASILVATTPLWMALMETLCPGGERLTVRGWLGLALGLAGVLVLLTPRLSTSLLASEQWHTVIEVGAILCLGSSLCWAFGSLILRRQRRTCSHLVLAAYQMFLGGTALSLIGLVAGEPAQLTPESFAPQAIAAFFYLLVVGSLIGFIAFTYLLGHVSAALAGTYAYVNPVVAVLVGWLLGGESVTAWIIGGMAVILAGVALVRTGGVVSTASTIEPDAAEPVEEAHG